jgi:hypothetical protein
MGISNGELLELYIPSKKRGAQTREMPVPLFNLKIRETLADRG